MNRKHSQAALIRMLESGIREIGDLDSKRFYIVVRDVKATGSPITKLQAFVVVRFLPAGGPFCCGEPSCYSKAFRDSGSEELGDFVRRKMSLQHEVSVELKVIVEFYDGIQFSQH